MSIETSNQKARPKCTTRHWVSVSIELVIPDENLDPVKVLVTGYGIDEAAAKRGCLSRLGFLQEQIFEAQKKLV